MRMRTRKPQELELGTLRKKFDELQIESVDDLSSLRDMLVRNKRQRCQ